MISFRIFKLKNILSSVSWNTMQFVTLVAFAIASIGMSRVAATALDSAHIPVNFDTYSQAAEHNTTLLAPSGGCGSTDPLGEGHFIWFITVGCNSGDV